MAAKVVVDASVVVVVSDSLCLMHQLLTLILYLRMFEGWLWKPNLLLHQ